MYGIDISNHQRNIDLTAGKYDFAIIKATEGISFTDPSFKKFAVQLTKLNKLVVWNHFASPDPPGPTSEMEKEADWFISVVRNAGLLNKAILVLDWETEPMDKEDLLNAFILRVENQTGITPFIYGSKYKLNSWKNWWAISHCPIWMALWPSISRPSTGIDPSFTKPDKTVNWTIWQYTSVGTYPNYKGRIDLDYCELTAEEWKKLAGMKTESIEASEVITEDMQWAIDNGIFTGYGNGKYDPKAPLTREQAATILKRFKKKFIK